MQRCGPPEARLIQKEGPQYIQGRSSSENVAILVEACQELGGEK